MQLSDDAPETPNINFAIIGKPKDDLRPSVVSALNISVDSLFLETAGTKVDDLDSRLVCFFEQNVLRLEISMDDLIFVEEVNSVEDLEGHSSDEVEGEPIVAIVLDEFIKIVGHEVKSHALNM